MSTCSLAVRVMLSLAAAWTLSCVAGDALPRAAVETTQVDTSFASLELACEIALEQLDPLLAARALEPDFPAERVAEAQELRDAAAALIAAGEFDVALDLIDSALSLLRIR